MKVFATRCIRGVLLGSLCGASTALVFRVAVELATKTQSYLKAHIPSGLLTAVTSVSYFRTAATFVVAGALLLSAWRIAAVVGKLYRSWRVGLVTGIIPVWFVLSFIFFSKLFRGDGGHFMPLVLIGLIPIGAALFLRNRILQAAVKTPTVEVFDSTNATANEPVNRDVTFDLPIHDWTEDRLSRTVFVREIANLVLKDKAPVVAVVGSFGEGKSSVLNLLEKTLAPRNDLIVASFSSWLPGDERVLAASLFRTISEGVESSYIVPGLTKELKQFARLLAGAVPKFGATLRQVFDEPSQVEQLSSLKKLLRRLPVRIVVLVDEVDRMDKAELNLLLKAIRGVVDLPNITYVCAFDKKSLTKLLGETDPVYGSIYLEKFFPVQLALPRIDQELLSTLFDRKLENICETFGLLRDEQAKKAFNEALLELWHTSIKRYLSNFRRMTLFFNALRMSLQPVSAEVNLFDMMVLQLVKMIWEDAYQFIYENGPLFYYSSWRITLWMERLSVDDRKEAAIRDAKLKAFFDTLPSGIKEQVKSLLVTIFPTVDHAVNGERFSGGPERESTAGAAKKIYHPDYFPRYFIHQVPAGMFGIAEMTATIALYNALPDVEQTVAAFRETINKLTSNPWKRYDFLDSFVAEADHLGEPQSEGVILGIADISDSFESDFLGVSDWGRARALTFAAAKRFEGTIKLQQVIVRAIQRCSSDGFAADILRYSTAMRAKNNLIADWRNVDEAAIRDAFARRMREKHPIGSNLEFPYSRDDLSPFFVWVHPGGEDKRLATEFFRDRFQRHPIELGRFLSWVLPKSDMVQGDPLPAVDRLFPLDELFDAVRQHDAELLEQDRESVGWFVELMAQRRANPAQVLPDEDAP
jgi:predicted KAP-like P-loop ATPase